MKNTKTSVGKEGFGIWLNTFTYINYSKETFDHKEDIKSSSTFVWVVRTWIFHVSLHGSAVLLLDLGRFFSFLILHTVGRTPWTSDQPVARPLPTQDSTNTEWTQTNIHALNGIRTQDPSVRGREDSSCLRPRGHRVRQYFLYTGIKES
jgi:hypothetical protein